MTSLTSEVVRHLRAVVDLPDLSQTKYQIVRALGRGGMGTVYLVRDTQLDRLVALKVLAQATSSEHRVDALEREARILARLEHPGIVPVHDAGSLPDGRSYYVMKFVRGDRLDLHLTRGLTLLARLQLFERVCDAVAFAHAHGVVHLDLKPSNVMVGEFGEVLVLDWGIARFGAADADGVVAGTPGYMAPEQALGAGSDHRADIHALGAILRDMLRDEERAPRALAAIADKAAAANPDDRYQQVIALSEDVARFRDGLPVSAYSENVLERLARLGGKYRVAIALVLAYVVMRVLLIALAGRG